MGNPLLNRLAFYLVKYIQRNNQIIISSIISLDTGRTVDFVMIDIELRSDKR